MKLEELQRMPIGEELNALVAEKVLELPVVWSIPYSDMKKKSPKKRPYLRGQKDGVVYDWAKVYSFSGSWAMSGLVIDAMTARGSALHLEQLIPDSDPPVWTAEFMGAEQGSCQLTAPHAVCIAALIRVGAYDEWEEEQARMAATDYTKQSYSALPLAKG